MTGMTRAERDEVLQEVTRPVGIAERQGQALRAYADDLLGLILRLGEYVTLPPEQIDDVMAPVDSHRFDDTPAPQTRYTMRMVDPYGPKGSAFK